MSSRGDQHLTCTNGEVMVLTSDVPRAQKIHAAGEEAGLENTKDNTERRHGLVVLREAHTDHDGTPQERNDSQMNARTNLTDDDG